VLASRNRAVKKVNMNLSKAGNVLAAIKDPISIAIAIITPCSNRISSQIALSFFTKHGNTITNYKLSIKGYML